jgi:poly(ribitol-phosphate) beta-N-acetylglucosaminyltransferase
VTGLAARPGLKVSVIVPVYNPGRDIDRCIESLLEQTLPPTEREIIFVDDGSSDGTEAYLDEVAKAHGDVKVIHQPNSGWPGRPRNVGIDHATADYIQFVDQDDSLGPEALERLWAFGSHNHADIVIGKVTSDFRPVPHELWRKNIAHCSIWDTALIDSLTPHKMFRRQYLNDNALRFPEGRRRLEDQVFMTAAYFSTDAVAILADYPCYFYSKRRHGGNAGAQDIEPVGYYNNLREVLDVVHMHTAPGALRDAFMSRFLRAIDLRVSGVVTDPSLKPEYIDALFAEAREIATERFPQSLVDALPPFRRHRVAALLANRLDLVTDMARETAAATAHAHVTSVSWEGSSWRLQIRVEFLCGDGSPLLVWPRDNRWSVDPRFTPHGVTPSSDSRESLLADAVANASLRRRGDFVEWMLPADLRPRLVQQDAEPDGPHTLIFEGQIDLKPCDLAGGSQVPFGKWDLLIRVRAFGIARVARTEARALVTDPRAALLWPEAVLLELRRTSSDRLLLEVAAAKPLAGIVRERLGAPVLERRRIVLPLDLWLIGRTPMIKAFGTIEWRHKQSTAAAAPAAIQVSESGATLNLRLPRRRRLRSGRAAVSVRLRRRGKDIALADVRFDWRRRLVELSPR